MRRSVFASWLFFCAVTVGIAPSVNAATSSRRDDSYIVGGAAIERCQWPTTAYIRLAQGICSGTLVHPKVVVYAAHCGVQVQKILFGETSAAAGRRVDVERCAFSPKYGANSGIGTDFAYCILKQSLKDIPLVPIAMGCELEALVPGAMVTLVGYGNTAGLPDGDGAGIKRQVEVPIMSVDPRGEIIVGTDGHGACHGDSGGPLFIQLPEHIDPQRGWRVAGATSRGPDNCPGYTIYGALSSPAATAWIEEDSGIDITPCFDADGTWNPGPDCGQFASDPRELDLSWSEGCDQMRLGPTASCAPPDTEPPTVDFVVPDQGATYFPDMKVAVEVAAQDDRVVISVELELDGDVVATWDAPPFVHDLSGLSLGQHRLVARAYDEAGHQSEAAARTVTIAVVEEDETVQGHLEGDDDNQKCTSSGGFEAGKSLGTCALMVAAFMWRSRKRAA